MQQIPTEMARLFCDQLSDCGPSLQGTGAWKESSSVWIQMMLPDGTGAPSGGWKNFDSTVNPMPACNVASGSPFQTRHPWKVICQASCPYLPPSGHLWNETSDYASVLVNLNAACPAPE